MKKNVTLLLASLLTSASLLASPNEESQGIEPPLVQANTQAPEDIFPLGLLPADVLRVVGDYLGDRDLLSLAHVNQASRETLLPEFLLRKAPTRVWLSGLAFQNTPDDQTARLTFVSDIMPSVMTAALRMFQYPSTKTKGDFETLLGKHAGFTSQGKKLGDTMLWTFLATLKDANVDTLDVTAFPANVATGDGDKVFLNMLTYIMSGFAVDPAILTKEEDLKKVIAKSPQGRMHQASLLKADIYTPMPLAQRVALWDKILDTFDNLTVTELEMASQDYCMQGFSVEDPETKAAYFLKSLRLAQQSLDMTDEPTRAQRSQAIHAYLNAIGVASKEEREGLISRAVDLVDTLFKTHTDVPGHDYVIAAGIYRAAFLASKTPEHKFFFVEKMRHRWDRYFLPANGFETSKRVHREAAMDYSTACRFAENELNKKRYAQKSADRWDAYFAPTPPAPDDEDEEDDETPTPEILQFAAQDYDRAAMMTTDLGEMAARNISAANAWDRFIAVGKPTPLDLKSAALAVSIKAMFAQSAHEQAALYMRSGEHWDRFLAASDHVTEDDMMAATKTWRLATMVTPNATLKIALHMRVAGMWDRFQEKNPELTPATKRQMAVDYAYYALTALVKEVRQTYCLKSVDIWDASAIDLKDMQPGDLALMARTFANAGLHTTKEEDLAKRVAHYRKGAQLWDAFWVQKPSASVLDMRDSARLYGILAPLTAHPETQKSLYRDAAIYFGGYIRFAKDKVDAALIPGMSEIFEKVASFSQDEKEVAFCLAQKQVLEEIKAKAAPKAPQL
ncbi:MAG: hypothetical protein LCH26_01770 [Proteobacteria bacterium]|nr:hypothetical protein [Pseudomonadota bacterium]